MENKKWELPIMDSLLHHKSMYKQTTPPWRETYRKKCYERLRINRQCLLDRFRGIPIEALESQNENKQANVQKLMIEEWNNLFAEQKMLPSLSSGDTDEVDNDSINEVVTFMERVQNELLQEEEKIMTEYHEILRLDESSLQASICHEEKNDVICPICQKNYLIQVHSTISCPCGLKIDTEQDCLTLAHLKQQLNQGVENHNRNCSGIVKFSATSFCGIVNLLMTCKHCDFMFIVI